MRWRNDNMLLRIAQADAYALAYEYVKEKDALCLKQELLKFERYHQHPTYHKMTPGMYSDDTQMSCAVAETLIANDNPTAKDFAEAFFRTFKRDKRDGYSRAFQAILESSKTVDEMRTAIVPDSNKNGAAMRSVPIGVIKDPLKIIDIAGIQAQVTHATWGGINSSIAVALMSHYSLYDNRSMASMYDWCCNWLPSFEHFRRPWDGPVHANNDRHNLGVGMITAHAVHTLLTTETTLMGILKKTIEWGGDTDSVASIAWGIASARFNDKIPQFFEEGLEVDGTYGPRFLTSLGNELMTKFQ